MSDHTSQTGVSPFYRHHIDAQLRLGALEHQVQALAEAVRILAEAPDAPTGTGVCKQIRDLLRDFHLDPANMPDHREAIGRRR